MELLTAAQMRAVERAAIESGAVTGLELMERAGAGVVSAILEEWPELASGERRAVVLCGPGNNGGDGFVVARLLRERGWAVEVFLYRDAERLPADARVNYERWLGMAEVAPINQFIPESYALRSGYDTINTCIIDAIFGTGLGRPVDEQLSRQLQYLTKSGLGGRPRIISVDIPSGVCADSGRILGAAMPAEQVVTFHRPKLGHYLAEGGERSVILSVKSIGLEQSKRELRDAVQLVPVDPVSTVASLDKTWAPDFRPAHHKYTHGHALILSGPQHHGGAARLSARGALRVGAGVVSVGASGDAMAEHAARLDGIMLRKVAGGAGLAEVLQDKRINALCLGPGMGLDARARDLLALALMGAPPPSPPHEGEGGRVDPGAALGDGAVPLPPVGRGQGWGARAMVLDADALTLIAADPTLFAALHKDCVLTPHAGEFARLFPDIAEKLNAPATKGPAYSKVDATREAAKRAGCVVLFKGPDTIIAAPDGRCAISAAVYDRAAPWLATAGSGDVLAGFITGLLARGFDPFSAAQTAAWLHVECALSFGPGLIAEDLPEELPKVFRKLGL